MCSTLCKFSNFDCFSFHRLLIFFTLLVIPQEPEKYEFHPDLIMLTPVSWKIDYFWLNFLSLKEQERIFRIFVVLVFMNLFVNTINSVICIKKKRKILSCNLMGDACRWTLTTRNLYSNDIVNFHWHLATRRDLLSTHHVSHWKSKLFSCHNEWFSLQTISFYFFFNIASYANGRA